MKRVAVAPLDWGLGHATRCIPIIQELLKRDCEVVIVSSGHALQLLQQEFPYLKAIKIVSYKVRYAVRFPFMLAVFLQVPKFMWVIWKEHHQLTQIIKDNQIDFVIADNRYGCWSGLVPSVFITHQTNIQMPALLKWMQPVVNYFNARFINRFSQCWIPDTGNAENLTGVLSRPGSIKITTRYIGILSRFSKTLLEHDFKYSIAAVLSGPEPQRSILEKRLLGQLRNRSEKIVVVRGIVEDKILWEHDGNVAIVNFLPGTQLQKVIDDSMIVISRSGYSTIMDLATLQKQAILIPTPGQTEQEYLADRLMKQGICFSMSQHNFNLTSALKQSLGFKGFTNIEVSNQLLSKALDEFLIS